MCQAYISHIYAACLSYSHSGCKGTVELTTAPRSECGESCLAPGYVINMVMRVTLFWDWELRRTNSSLPSPSPPKNKSDRLIANNHSWFFKHRECVIQLNFLYFPRLSQTSITKNLLWRKIVANFSYVHFFTKLSAQGVGHLQGLYFLFYIVNLKGWCIFSPISNSNQHGWN